VGANLLLNKLKFLLLSLSLLSASNLCFAQAYRKSTEGKDVVKDKLFPKKRKLELALNPGGMVLNESYVRTFLIGGGGSYFFSEEWGAGVDFSLGLNNDKPERDCIENFYNDPNGEVADNCGSSDMLSGTTANMGPAYVPIREIQSIVLANAIWNPIYGKALMFMSGTIYFDLFIEGGLGIAMSKLYPKMETLNNGKKSRGDYLDANNNGNIDQDEVNAFGADINDTESFGKEGRPTPENGSNIVFNLGVGQKFHFAKRFHIKMFIRNMTLLGTDSGFENFFALYGGAGVRF
jgi:outer membrane beta-barrel protein